MGLNAQTAVPTFTAAQILTAAQQNQINTGIPVFADTTARNAAFGGAGEKVLAEGQFCYLENTNVTQYYDGSSWVALTPAISAANMGWVLTTQSTGATVYGDLATAGPSVTLTTGTSVMVIHGCFANDDGNLGNNAYQSVAISGATTQAAADDWSCIAQEADNGLNTVMAYKFTVTAGSNTFTCKYKKAGGTSTASFGQRWIMVFAL